MLCCRLNCELPTGHLSGVVCVQCPAPLPGAMVCVGGQRHQLAVPVPLLHPAVLLLWQHCCGAHLGFVPPQLQLQGSARQLSSTIITVKLPWTKYVKLLALCIWYALKLSCLCHHLKIVTEFLDAEFAPEQRQSVAISRRL